MTLKSMTGFGQGQAEGGGLRVDIEISSVNRKQLDVSVNLPRSLQSLEPWIVEQVSRHLSRGRVSIQVGVRYAGKSGHAAVHIDLELARACVKELKQAARALGLAPELSMHEVIRLPGVVVVEEAGQDLAKVKPVMEKALDRAVAAFMAMRKDEGAQLMRDVADRMERLESMAGRVAERAPGLVDGYRKTLRDRISQLAGELRIEDERLEKEVVLFADRADISEELTRLRSHFKQARGMFRQKDPAGRSLDFLAQEMFREINTIGSKAGDSVISALVVQFKAELERFREQVQNIE